MVISYLVIVSHNVEDSCIWTSGNTSSEFMIEYRMPKRRNWWNLTEDVFIQAKYAGWKDFQTLCLINRFLHINAMVFDWKPLLWRLIRWSRINCERIGDMLYICWKAYIYIYFHNYSLICFQMLMKIYSWKLLIVNW